MFKDEYPATKEIVTPDGEDEFQLRYIQDDNVGIATTRSGKSYLILDSIDYWYDLIQDRYPPKRKCRCKNDYFKLRFGYIPRIGTDDYRAVMLTAICTECGKEKKIAEIDIDYSPTTQLFENPITYCEQPKIKYKLHSISGYWGTEAFHDLISFLAGKQIFIYCCYWTKENRWGIKRVEADELERFLFIDESRYSRIYFSMEALEELCFNPFSWDSVRDIWRKREIIQINDPLRVCLQDGLRDFYSIDCCSEYIEAGEVKSKGKPFCKLIQEFLLYSKERLKQS